MEVYVINYGILENKIISNLSWSFHKPISEYINKMFIKELDIERHKM